MVGPTKRENEAAIQQINAIEEFEKSNESLLARLIAKYKTTPGMTEVLDIIHAQAEEDNYFPYRGDIAGTPCLLKEQIELTLDSVPSVFSYEGLSEHLSRYSVKLTEKQKQRAKQISLLHPRGYMMPSTDLDYIIKAGCRWLFLPK